MKVIMHLWSKIFQDKRWFTISNMLTVSRFVLTPFVVCAIYYHAWMTAAVIFACAAVTDMLDGYLARIRNERTYLGTLLDPLADKFLLVASFGALSLLHTMPLTIPAWFFLIVLGRETIMLCGAALLLLFYKNVQIGPLIWGKITTLIQIIFLLWIFVCYFAGWEPRRTYKFLLIALTLFSLISLWKYIHHTLQSIRSVQKF
jgi:cardiolipin synthase